METVATRNPMVREAVVRVIELSKDERTRLLDESREKFLRDNATRMRGAMDEGIAKGKVEGAYSMAMSIAKNLIAANMPIEAIASATGLTRAEIEGLKN